MSVCLSACLSGTSLSKGLFIFLIQIFQMFFSREPVYLLSECAVQLAATWLCCKYVHQFVSSRVGIILELCVKFLVCSPVVCVKSVLLALKDDLDILNSFFSAFKD